jgi:hypothetical protein
MLLLSLPSLVTGAGGAAPPALQHKLLLLVFSSSHSGAGHAAGSAESRTPVSRNRVWRIVSSLAVCTDTSQSRYRIALSSLQNKRALFSCIHQSNTELSAPLTWSSRLELSTPTQKQNPEQSTDRNKKKKDLLANLADVAERRRRLVRRARPRGRRRAEQREPPVLAGELVGAVHSAVARVAERGFVGAAEHRGRLGRAHVALQLHLPTLSLLPSSLPAIALSLSLSGRNGRSGQWRGVDRLEISSTVTSS